MAILNQDIFTRVSDGLWTKHAWILRLLLMDSITPPAMIAAVQDAVGRVRVEVLTRRLRDALKVAFSPVLASCTTRIICIWSAADRFLATRGLRECLAAKKDVEAVKVTGPHFLLQCAPHACLVSLQELGLLGRDGRPASKNTSSLQCRTSYNSKLLEARSGFEPLNKGFADLYCRV